MKDLIKRIKAEIIKTSSGKLRNLLCDISIAIQAVKLPIVTELTASKETLEYAIIPISFKDYNEYIECLNEFGKDGWIFSTKIRTHKDSPFKGVTTHDFICYRNVIK